MNKSILLLLCALVLATIYGNSLARPTPKDEFCAAVGVLFNEQAGWEIVPDWSDAAYARGDIPPDLEHYSYLPLTDNGGLPEETQGLDMRWSAERHEYLLFAFWSLQWGTAPDGTGGGTHDMCQPRRLNLDEQAEQRWQELLKAYPPRR